MIDPPHVMAGLDPAIHAEVAAIECIAASACRRQRTMDHRVKPGDDESEFMQPGIIPAVLIRIFHCWPVK
jgi:hypothetical protein